MVTVESTGELVKMVDKWAIAKTVSLKQRSRPAACRKGGKGQFSSEPKPREDSFTWMRSSDSKHGRRRRSTCWVDELRGASYVGRRSRRPMPKKKSMAMPRSISVNWQPLAAPILAPVAL